MVEKDELGRLKDLRIYNYTETGYWSARIYGLTAYAATEDEAMSKLLDMIKFKLYIDAGYVTVELVNPGDKDD